MALTRANTEAILVKRAGPLMTAAGMAVTVIGSNADLNDPIWHAIRDLGYTVSNPVSITDADVAQITVAQYTEYLDMAELHTFEAILGNYDDVDITAGPRTESLSQTVDQLENKIDRLTKKLEKLYGYGFAVVSARVITKKFAEHD